MSTRRGGVPRSPQRPRSPSRPVPPPAPPSAPRWGSRSPAPCTPRSPWPPARCPTRSAAGTARAGWWQRGGRGEPPTAQGLCWGPGGHSPGPWGRSRGVGSAGPELAGSYGRAACRTGGGGTVSGVSRGTGGERPPPPKAGIGAPPLCLYWLRGGASHWQPLIMGVSASSSIPQYSPAPLSTPRHPPAPPSTPLHSTPPLQGPRAPSWGGRGSP